MAPPEVLPVPVENVTAPLAALGLLDVPVDSDMAPVARESSVFTVLVYVAVPLPPMIVTAPPDENALVFPAVKVRDPPAPVSPSPAANEIPPAWPAPAVPVPTLTDPAAPEFVLPD